VVITQLTTVQAVAAYFDPLRLQLTGTRFYLNVRAA
jgi:hypothetical protein